MANLHKRRNSIPRLYINSKLVREEEVLRQGIVNAFESLLLDTKDWRANPVGLNFSKLNALQAENLERPFSELEVFSDLNDLNGDKAPRPNGYTMAFWQFN